MEEYMDGAPLRPFPPSFFRSESTVFSSFGLPRSPQITQEAILFVSLFGSYVYEGSMWFDDGGAAHIGIISLQKAIIRYWKGNPRRETAMEPSFSPRKSFKWLYCSFKIDPQICSGSIFGLFSVIVVFFCCVYFDIRAIPAGLLLHTTAAGKLNAFAENPSSAEQKFDIRSISEPKRPVFSQSFNQCDLSVGSWVWDEAYPLYQSPNCPFIDVGFRCQENGRPDTVYTKWRWQPSACNLPRFNASNMLDRIRNRRVIFVGDSIGRNQWESLICMLAEAVPNKLQIYEVNGSPITKHKGFLSFRFEEFNCTVEYYRAPFLVLQGRPPKNSPPEVRTTLKLDLLDWTSVHWRDADILIFNAGHWWNYEKTLRGGCYFQEGDTVNMTMDVQTAFKKSMKTLAEWILQQVDTEKTHVFFRSYAPVHFRGGTWKTGGHCHLETLPALSPVGFSGEQPWINNQIIYEAFERLQHKKNVQLLNVTYLTILRKDGHSSLYYLGDGSGPASIHRQDCSHWCLPGVPDTWNQLLYAYLIARGYGD